MAEDKAAYIEQLAHPLDSLVLLSEVLNFDFARRGSTSRSRTLTSPG